MRFSAGSEGMEHRCGVLGLEKHYVGGHEMLVEATKTMFIRFATRGVNRPSRGTEAVKNPKELGKPSVHDSGLPGVYDEALDLKGRRDTEFFCTDAEGQEVLAGNTLTLTKWLANCIANTRDKCHRHADTHIHIYAHTQAYVDPYTHT